MNYYCSGRIQTYVGACVMDSLSAGQLTIVCVCARTDVQVCQSDKLFINIGRGLKWKVEGAGWVVEVCVCMCVCMCVCVCVCVAVGAGVYLC